MIEDEPLAVRYEQAEECPPEENAPECIEWARETPSENG